MDLSQIDGKSIAMVLDIPGRKQLIRGMARYDFDEALGWHLRITLAPDHPEQGHTSFIIQEDVFEGEFEVDTEYGCDLRLALSSGVSVGG